MKRLFGACKRVCLYLYGRPQVQLLSVAAEQVPGGVELDEVQGQLGTLQDLLENEKRVTSGTTKIYRDSFSSTRKTTPPFKTKLGLAKKKYNRIWYVTKILLCGRIRSRPQMPSHSAQVSADKCGREMKRIDCGFGHRSHAVLDGRQGH